MLKSLPEGQQYLHYTGYIEPFMVYLKVALYGGIFVAAPWVLLQLWLFVAPGLYKRERTVVVPFLASATLLFYGGAAFCYFLVMPYAFPALAAIAGEDMKPILTMTEQLSLVLAMLLGFGVVFEVPVIIGVPLDDRARVGRVPREVPPPRDRRRTSSWRPSSPPPATPSTSP